MCTLLLGVWPAHASAQERDTGPRNGYGIRAGFGLTPDQFVLGLQTLLGEKLRILRFAPSFDFGFGDNQTTYALNADFTLHVPLPSTRSQIYLGAGPALVVWNPDQGGADTEVGLNLIGGTRLATRGRTLYNVEVRFAVGDAPDFRLLLGVLFGSGRPATAP
jgi:hypothetical protein